jgi:Ca2+-binding RTX toxin-like protein
VVALALAFGSAQSVLAATDGSDVVDQLHEVSAIVNGLLEATQGLGDDPAVQGDEPFSKQTNANAIPFLGGTPGSLVEDLFTKLDLSALDGVTAADADEPSQVAAVFDDIDGMSATLMCGAVECTDATHNVVDISAIDLVLDLTDSKGDDTTHSFTSLNLPSLGFLPQGAGHLDIDLTWTLKIGLHVTADDITLSTPSGGHMFELGAKIKAPTGNPTVNLGVLVVEARTDIAPLFEGTLYVDIDPDGNLDFGFLPGAKFEAKWHLHTTDASPLRGVVGDLHILWELGAVTDTGVDPTKLSIKLENVEIETNEFVGEDIQDAAKGLRDVVHPIRQVTSPMLEPIPGLSDLSSAVGNGDVTMLRIMGLATAVDPTTGVGTTFPYEKLELALKRIQMLDDVAKQLGGGGNVQLGSFTLAESVALTPNKTPLPPGAVDTLTTIVEACGPCEQKLGELLGAVNGDPTPGSQQGFQFDVPVMSDPASLAGLLLGRDVDIITFDTGFQGYRGDIDSDIARFFIFAVKLEGKIVAGIHLKGGVDTAGVIAAMQGGGVEDLLNGVYLQNPGDPEDNEPIVELSSTVGLGLGVDVKELGVDIRGAPSPDIRLRFPDSTDKMRPALLKANATTVGCQLIKNGSSEFSVKVIATFDYVVDEHVEILADHTFLTADDLCAEAPKDIKVAYPDGPNVIVNPAFFASFAAEEPALVKVYMVHEEKDGKLEPKTIVVEGNGGAREEFDAALFDAVRFTAPSDWTRDVNFRVVKNDEIKFEEKVFIETGKGADDVVVDSSAFGQILVGEGNDKVTVTSGLDPNGPIIPVSGGQGDDLLIGGEHKDVLQGNEGEDTIQGGGGGDELRGGPGDDVLTDGSAGGNCFVGGTGVDVLISGAYADTMFGDEVALFGNEASSCGNLGSNPENDAEPGDGNDVIITGGGADFVIAGGGDDVVRLEGKNAFEPNDSVWSTGITVHGNGGADTITTGNGRDWIHGGPGNDTISSDVAPKLTSFRVGDIDQVWGGLGDDTISAGDADDVIYGDNGHDACSAAFVGQPVETQNAGGDDHVRGGPGADRISLEAGDDDAQGNGGDDVICGHAGADEIYGDTKPGAPGPGIGDGTGDDTVFGGTGTDSIFGGPELDLLFGNAGQDSVYGEDGADRIVGGSNAAGIADVGDLLSGGEGEDVLVGDNGSISSATPRVVQVFDLFANDSTLGFGDTIAGEGGADRAFGGLGFDTISGGDADDHLEGNNGDDEISGNDGDDDIIGGTSDEALPGAAAGQSAADAPDTGETILSGGAGLDVIIGDNGDIIRPGGTDPILGGPARAVVLFDRDRTGAALASVSGGDYVEGNGASDRIYGQGGDDYLKGNDADDYVEGNQGGDRLEGNDGEDDLIGGSSFLVSAGVGDPDGSDQVAGGAGADVLLGDNAAITRATTGSGAAFDWDSVANSWLGQVARRSITLLDKQALASSNYGDDVLSGGGGADVLFGQDGVDRLFGGADDDYMEGNGAGDVLFGDLNAAPTGSAHESPAAQLDGAPGPDGQDDQVGGSSWARNRTGSGAITGQRDGADELHGDGNADVQLGDNGRILRVIVDGEYATFEALTGKPTKVRQASPGGTAPTALPARFDVGASAAAGVWGTDTLYGDAGDDTQLAGDGDDSLFGGADDDDMYGELGADRMFGEGGEDAIVGDRGVITNRLVTTPGATIAVTSPPSVRFTPFAAHPLDRRVDLNDDGDGAPLQAPGMTTGGNDYLRGGPDHDAMHGAAGNDVMNGDAGGDYLFGADGADVLWGGQGRECADPADFACNGDRGADDRFVDYLFGGAGLRTDPVTGGADILDFRPRPGSDPVAWFEATNTRGTDPIADHQHHQGIDWIYGGWDRDVLQADIADNGPNEGDRLMDWTGAYNLYNHCPSAYGGYTDVRLFSPTLQAFLQQLAFSLGAGKSLSDVGTAGTSGYNELALVFTKDVKANSGSAYPGTPGHFDDFSCAP